MANQVLHAPPLPSAVFNLCFHRWHWQSRALFKPLRYKVLLAVDNIPTHLWLCDFI
jgi:hypothetical protein